MAKDILKEAIADAKAVREVALANAKAALEEAFTPKLQSMLSAKLSEDLDEAEDMEEIGYGMEEDMDERMYDEDMDETVGMEKEEKEMEEDLDEEFNLEEILSELELEEAKDEDKVDEAKKDDDDKEMEESVNPLQAELDEAKDELEETKKAFKTVRAELNEVNLLNSKLLYVNRIFKANQLNESQKLRVVESLDKAGTAKEAKLIYETIKDTFNISKSEKRKAKTSIKEGLGMASKAAGKSTAPKKEVISESNDMMLRFQKLANIKINQ